VTSQLVRLGAYTSFDSATDPAYSNAGGWVVHKDGTILSMRSALPASASVVYTSPANTGNSYSILAFDATDETSVARASDPYDQVYGLQTFYPGQAAGALLDGEMLYTSHTGALVALDASDPLNPTELGRYVNSTVDANQPRMRTPLFVDADGLLWGGHAIGSTASGSRDGIAAFDVSDPTAPTLSALYHNESSFDTFGQGNQSSTTSWDDRWVAAVDFQSFAVRGVRIWDTSDPTATPVDYLFCMRRDSYNTVVWDVSDPLSPVEVTSTWHLHSRGGSSGSDHRLIAVDWAPWLVVANWNDNGDRYLALIDFSDPTTPVKLHEVQTGNAFALGSSNIHWQGLYAAGDRFYTADFSGRAAVWQVTEVDPPSLPVIGRLSVA
jgi:hypothetical protein